MCSTKKLLLVSSVWFCGTFSAMLNATQIRSGRFVGHPEVGTRAGMLPGVRQLVIRKLCP